MIVSNVKVPACLAGGSDDTLEPVSIVIDDGRIARLAPADTAGDIDGRGGIAVPAFVDMHTHLDKGHIWARTPNPDGTFAGALTATQHDRFNHWSAEDVRRRMEFALQCAYAHGTRAIRTHLDSIPPQDKISWPLFSEIREEWADRIALQAASLVGIDGVPDDPRPMFDYVSAHGGIVGAVLYPVDAMPMRLRALMEEAAARGMDIDFHVDESLNPESNCLEAVAREALRIGFPGKIVCGHCCSLMAMDEADALRTLDLVAQAGIAVVSLPLCNLYLQDRKPGRTPRIRGGTLVHEMAERGIAVSIASDNTRDPFYAYGDLDMVEVWREATRVLHLDHPVGAWPAAFSQTPASVMGVAPQPIAPGAPADLVILKARDWSELFARPHTDRIVIRGGRKLEATPPDYRELDDF